MVPAGASNDDIIESADAWYAQVGAQSSADAGSAASGETRAELPEHLREGNVV